MSALYNEIDKNAAAWLRQLIIAGHIAPGVVDERDIRDLEPDYVASFTQCHFFAGIGVWSHALRLAGWPDDRPVWTGSCPCQPFSAAGKGGGFDDERHLWPAFHHLIEQCRPDVVLGEQVASKDGLGWLDLVHADLEGTGYAVGAVDTCAAGFGAPHIRQRLWWCGVAGRAVEHADGTDAAQERAGHDVLGGQRAPLGRGSVEQSRLGAGGGARGRDHSEGASGTGDGGDAVAARHPSRLADALDPIGRADLSAGHDRYWPHAGRSQDSGDTGSGRGLCGVGSAKGDGHERRGQLDQSAGRNGAAHGGADNSLGFTHPSAGQPHPIPTPQLHAPEPDRLDDHDSDGPRQTVGGVHLGRPQPDGGQLRPGPTNGVWGAADWLHCRDGRWRPVEPGTFPLAHGAAARVGRLRGYGNAIVAPAAQAFVESVMEAVS